MAHRLPWVLALLALTVAGGLAPSGALGAVAHHPASPGSGARPGTSSDARALPGASAGTGASPPPAAPGPIPSSVCATLRARYAMLYDGPVLPPPVAVAAQSGGCPIGADSAGLGLVSSAPMAGARTELTVALPGAGDGATRALSAFGVGLWVSGVACSAGGASYLTLELVPPYGGVGPTASPNWTMVAPVFDLVPAGGCDPRCENQTALYHLGGSDRAFCEETAVVRGPASGESVLGSWPAGDRLSIALVGAVGASDGLSVFVNDSTRPSLTAAWNYSGASTVSGDPLEPLSNGTGTPPGTFWGSGPELALLAALCPSAAPRPPPAGASCNSYDGTAVNASSLPRLADAESWNASDGTYDIPYPWIEPFSSSGACSGGGSVAPCDAFATGGGSGNYPFFDLQGRDGNASVGFGGPGPSVVSELGGPGQFPSDGAPAVPRPAIGVSGDRVVATSSGINVTSRLTAPAGVGSATLSVFFCSSGLQPSESSAPATAVGGAPNGPTDGNYSASVSFSAGEQGTVAYWWTVGSADGAVLETDPATATVTSGIRLCHDAGPAAPDFTLANVTSIAGGYRLTLHDNSSGVRNYTLSAVPYGGGPSQRFVLRGPGPIDVGLGRGGTAWNLSLTATDADGVTSAAAAVAAPAPPDPLAAVLAGWPPSGLWIGADRVALNLSAAGGVAPYSYALAFPNGSLRSTTSAAPFWNVSVDLGPFDGVVFVAASVVDADGLGTTAAPLGLSVGAGPLGVDQSASAGANDVRLVWTPPTSPAAPVTGYTVFYTNASAAAPTLSGIWPANDSATGAFLWNTTGTVFDVPLLAPGTTYYLLVVAWNAYGIGLLPDGWLAAPSVTTANLTAGPIEVLPSGGPAPLTVAVADKVSLGTNGSLVEALYSFGSEGNVAANATPFARGVYADWWLNASWTFPSSGPETIVLHVVDAYADSVIPVASIFVGVASAPSALARVTSGTAVVGEPVDFEGIAGGGTGAFAYNWSFGDGGGSTEASPAHTYFTGGNYTAVLTVIDTGDGQRSYASVNLTVYALPSAAITHTATDPLATSYEFTALVGGGVAPFVYAWTFGDGTTENGASVGHAYGSSGTFTVTLTVTDGLRHTATASVVVAVPPSGGPGTESAPALTAPVLAAFALLGTLALVLVIATVYYWSSARDARSARPVPGRSAPPAPDDGPARPPT